MSPLKYVEGVVEEKTILESGKGNKQRVDDNAELGKGSHHRRKFRESIHP